MVAYYLKPKKKENIVLLTYVLMCFLLALTECSVFNGKFDKVWEKRKHNAQHHHQMKSKNIFSGRKYWVRTNETDRNADKTNIKNNQFCKGWIIVLFVLTCTFGLYCGAWRIHRRCFPVDDNSITIQDCI